MMETEMCDSCKTSFKADFEAYRDKCLGQCKSYYSKPHDELEYLQYKIEDPIKAWANTVANAKMGRLGEWFKDLFYSAVGAELFKRNSVWQPLYQWTNSFWNYPRKEQRCAVSPKSLELEGGWDKDSEVWYWRTPDITWDHMFGRGGYCVVRNGKIIWSVITEMN